MNENETITMTLTAEQVKMIQTALSCRANHLDDQGWHDVAEKYDAVSAAIDIAVNG